MNLLQLKKATAVVQPNHSILIYGPPKGGKSRLVGTAAKIKELNRIYWIDIENGVETLLNMGLTDEELAKITIIKIADTRDNPIALETILKAFTSKVPVAICEAHGRVDCAECTKSGSPVLRWCLASCNHNDLVVLDSGSQLGDSALAAACLGKPNMFKPTFDEYGMVNKWLGDVCSVIQQCVYTNFVVITHDTVLKDDENKDRIFPLFGSTQFSMKCAKFFGTVVYVHKKMNKHTAGSGSTYRSDLLTGSRVGIALESHKEPSMQAILVDGGILKSVVKDPSVSTPSQEEEKKEDTTAVVTEAQPSKPLTLAEKLKLKPKS